MVTLTSVLRLDGLKHEVSAQSIVRTQRNLTIQKLALSSVHLSVAKISGVRMLNRNYSRNVVSTVILSNRAC